MDSVIYLAWSLQLVSTLAMVGVIWFVQVVHYPLMSSVYADQFPQFEQSHQQRTTWVVAPLMLTECFATGWFIFIRPESLPAWAPLLGGLLLTGIWASTFFWPVPLHGELTRSYNPAVHKRLVDSNWLRTALWTLRGVLVVWMGRFI